DDIDAACGQLVGQVADRTRRNERYLNAQAVTDEQTVRIVGGAE
ncbi:MAG: 23S rRNA (adenine(2503)-C(2))-methyltransferase RlmN, partial [Cellvibrionales bacterium]|nr:23S rRNA (adenine(2503)-C(2))-methyltransferase RlmN [Cellvibrionales bacterium]